MEFKQTARWNVKEQKKDKVMEEVIVKTVAGFLYGQGGTLLIGVTDGRPPVGLDDDYALVKPANADGYVGWLDTLLEKSLGHAGAHRVPACGSTLSAVLMSAASTYPPAPGRSGPRARTATCSTSAATTRPGWCPPTR